MIKSLNLYNFKCFDELRLPMSNLTLITGVNGAGKSTIIQSLLMLRQSNDDKVIDLHNQVKLDGDLIDLVSAESVRCASTEDTDITIEISDENKEKASFKLIDAITDQPVIKCQPSDNIDKIISTWSLFDKNFVYLYADRTAPLKNYQKGVKSNTDSRLGDKHGNEAAFRFYEAISSGEKLQVEALQLLKDDATVFGNTSAWISRIMDAQMQLAAHLEGVERVVLTYSRQVKGEEVISSPLNVAFGNSYIFPIVLAVLTAPIGSLIIVENPEAHLHPAAQFKMGQFLALAAQNGIQIVVETHSEHLLNGIRLMTKEKKLDAGNVEIHYIYQDAANPDIHLDDRIILEEDGTLNRWPKGFFDEWEQALRSLNDDEL